MTTTYVELPSGTILETKTPKLWPEAKRVPVSEARRRLKSEAVAELLKMLKPGDTVYSIIRSVAASGMSRRIDFYIFPDGQPRYLTGYVAKALESWGNHDGGLRVDGCGMDMAFATVYNLGATLWPHGTPKPHGKRNGEPDSTGGYALKSSII